MIFHFIRPMYTIVCNHMAVFDIKNEMINLSYLKQFEFFLHYCNLEEVAHIFLVSVPSDLTLK